MKRVTVVHDGTHPGPSNSLTYASAVPDSRWRPKPQVTKEAAAGGLPVELDRSWRLRSDERVPAIGATLNRLEAGKQWARRTLEDLARGKAVSMWWWERMPPREQTLVLVGGDERRVSVRFRERVLRACAEDPEARAEVTRQLIAAIERVSANPSEPQGS